MVLCGTGEYVGRTMRDIPTLVATGDYYPGLELAFTNTDTFYKHMFEYVYSFYCMNMQGVIHGDVHLNNVTIMRLYRLLDPAGKPYTPGAKVCYMVGDTSYVFPHHGLFSCIIDFSRAILGDEEQLCKDFGQTFTADYMKRQKDRVLALLFVFFPKTLERYRNGVEGLLISNFPLMFKIISALDVYVLMSNIKTMTEIDGAFKGIKLAPGATELLNNLITRAENNVAQNIKLAVELKITSVDQLEWPNLTILQECFAKYIGDVAGVVDIYNSNRDVVYDVANYDTWGPLLALDKEIELRRKYKQPMHQGIMDWLDYKNTEIDIDAVVRKYASPSVVPQFESWMLD
jgi:hypothetical protein